MQSFKSWDDIQIAYREWGGEGPAASPPVVLHHGFAADANADPSFTRSIVDSLT